MSLLALYDQNQNHFDEMNIEQIIAICGDGKLKDNSEALNSFRAHLKRINSEKIFEFSNYCLTNSFKDSGCVLQDLANEIGRRLDFEVENGLYQGRSNQIGFDGLWQRNDGFNLVVEVKTTDTYRINLDKIAEYREKLIKEGKIQKKHLLYLL